MHDRHPHTHTHTSYDCDSKCAKVTEVNKARLGIVDFLAALLIIMVSSTEFTQTYL